MPNSSDEDAEWLADKEYILEELKNFKSRLDHKYEEVSLLSDRIVELEAVIRGLLARVCGEVSVAIPENRAVEMLSSTKNEGEWALVEDRVRATFSGVLPGYWDSAVKKALFNLQELEKKK